MRRSTEEQDRAAGGAERRQLAVLDGAVVQASVAVRTFKKSRQLYGYLQFKHCGKTVTRYIGKVTAETRAEALGIGWGALRTRRIAEANGWRWADGT